MPVRIQRQRTKGWRLPENTVVVTRPTVGGNRWKIGVFSKRLGRNIETQQEAVDCYRELAWPEPHQRAYVREMLKGKNLACWCKLPKEGEPDVCHATVLLQIANEDIL